MTGRELIEAIQDLARIDSSVLDGEVSARMEVHTEMGEEVTATLRIIGAKRGPDGLGSRISLVTQ